MMRISVRICDRTRSRVSGDRLSRVTAIRTPDRPIAAAVRAGIHRYTTAQFGWVVSHHVLSSVPHLPPPSSLACPIWNSSPRPEDVRAFSEGELLRARRVSVSRPPGPLGRTMKIVSKPARSSRPTPHRSPRRFANIAITYWFPA